MIPSRKKKKKEKEKEKREVLTATLAALPSPLVKPVFLASFLGLAVAMEWIRMAIVAKMVTQIERLTVDLLLEYALTILSSTALKAAGSKTAVAGAGFEKMPIDYMCE